ncbi:hypothetical protein [Comamonas odontotermitis]|uniref:hypothetical protein n=1 Tax=Comamonas odontotermitis TaxID=379895 RepID=UPI001CC63CE8|nr:hypothetical protein [Comamonas odontotermitis]UBB17764.1 hypothetical protein LAD35_03720 [Comamonas odontotermitis]
MEAVIEKPRRAAKGETRALAPAATVTPSLDSNVTAPEQGNHAPTTKPARRKRSPAGAPKTAMARKAGAEILSLVESASITMHLVASDSGEDYVFGLHHLTDWLYEKCESEIGLIKNDPSEAVSLLGIVQADIVSVVAVIERLPEPSSVPVFKVISAALRLAMNIANAVEEARADSMKALWPR